MHFIQSYPCIAQPFHFLIQKLQPNFFYFKVLQNFPISLWTISHKQYKSKNSAGVCDASNLAIHITEHSFQCEKNINDLECICLTSMTSPFCTFPSFPPSKAKRIIPKKQVLTCNKSSLRTSVFSAL